MSRQALVSFLMLLLAMGCGDNSAGKKHQDQLPADAAIPIIETPDAATVPPVTGVHLDGIDNDYQPHTSPAVKPATKQIELVLRSSPPGAIASIDGTVVGTTPAFWRGPTDDRQHEFIFVKEGYAIARYRFVATHSGVVHGTLKRLLDDERHTH